jgi:tRNA dimethylallyltransferase
MFKPELYDETKKLVQKYGWDNGAMKSDIYEYAWKYLQGELSLEEAKLKCFYEDWHLAKHQMTWFKRNKNIVWCRLDKIENAILESLA